MINQETYSYGQGYQINPNQLDMSQNVEQLDLRGGVSYSPPHKLGGQDVTSILGNASKTRGRAKNDFDEDEEDKQEMASLSTISKTR